MLRTKSTLIVATALVALTALPLEAAQARDHGWGHHGFGPFGVVAAVVGTAAAIATLPFAAVGAVVAPAPPAAYYGPPAAYYGPGPGYGPPAAYYRGGDPYRGYRDGGYRSGGPGGYYESPRYTPHGQGYYRP